MIASLRVISYSLGKDAARFRRSVAVIRRAISLRALLTEIIHRRLVRRVLQLEQVLHLALDGKKLLAAQTADRQSEMVERRR
jgi:hypothetical protein